MSYTSREVYEYISKQTADPIVERKVCRVSGSEFPIFQSDLDFYDKISPTFATNPPNSLCPPEDSFQSQGGVKKFQIPTPTLCPEERQRRRLAFRNERKLYRRKCDFSGKDIISIYSADKPYKVYDQKIRRSDSRDPMEYGFEFDFTKTFTENFDGLMLALPRSNFYGTNNENSDYTNHCNYSKDCYLCADLVRSESCLYSTTSIDSINTIDCFLATNSKYVYETSCSDAIYNSQYIINSKNCKNSSFLINCENCENCFGCTNLYNKRFYIFNKGYGEKEYFERLVQIRQEFNSTSRMNDIVKGIIQNQFILQNCERCFGDNIQNSKDSILNFSLYDSQNIKYSYTSGRFTDSYDCLETGLNCSLLYECHAVMDSYKSGFISISYNNNNSYYLDNCYNNSDVFGCIGLRKKQYCIFNKQYTKEEYEIQVAKIITHMQETGERGEFFHPSLSPFGYNETVAMEYYPLERGKEEKTERGEDLSISSSSFLFFSNFGYHRSDYSSDPKIPDNAQVIKPQEIDDQTWKHLRDDDTVLRQVIVCAESGRPFMIQKAELEFYRKHDISLPRKHPDVRHEERAKLRTGRTLHMRNCDKCEKEMLSVYPLTMAASDKRQVTETGDLQLEAGSQTVYCESCYQKKIYG